MDETDRRLLGLLRENSRLPIKALADRLGVARGTVQNRLERLVESGEILGFTVRLKSEESPQGVRAITLIQEQAKDTKRLVRALRQIPEVTALYNVSGRWDLMVEMTADTLKALDRAIGLIRALERVATTETIILLDVHKEM